MRMTRAALRAQESEEALRAEIDTQLKQQKAFEAVDDLLIHEDSDKENSGLIESGDRNLLGDRVVFQDITAHNYPTAETVAEMPAKKAARTKKPQKDRLRAAEPECGSSEISQDDLTVTHTKVDEEGAMGSDQHTMETRPFLETTIEPRTSHVEQESDGELQTTSDKLDDVIKAMDFVTEDHISDNMAEKMVKTPRFDPSVHLPVDNGSFTDDSALEDSFVGTIKARSPGKHANTQHSSTNFSLKDNTSATPAKLFSSPRVEDSVAALDALEDAIEKFADELPTVDSMGIDSPTKVRTVSLKVKTPAKQTSNPSLKSSTKAIAAAKPTSKSSSTKNFTERLADSKQTSVKERVKAIEARPNTGKHRRATSVAITKSSTTTARPLTKPGHSVSKSVSSISAKPLLSMSNSPIKEQPELGKKRVTSGPLSTSKPGFVPAKSVKPPTKASFVLPGEAVAAKLKAQRDERLSKEESATEKRKEFKARPNLVKTVRPIVVPRENKASQARMSLVVKQGGENKENVAPVKAAPAKTLVIPAKTQVKQSEASPNDRKDAVAAAKTNTGKKPGTLNVRVISTSSATSATSASSTVKTAAKGKEVYGRHRLTLVEQQREKKEKEEAAKKARAEAAERGRQASREWAEKQKRKLLAEKEAKLRAEGDSTLTA